MVAVFLLVHPSLVFAGSGILAFGLIERVGFAILLAATIDREGPAVRPGADSGGTALDEPPLAFNGSRSADLVG